MQRATTLRLIDSDVADTVDVTDTDGTDGPPPFDDEVKAAWRERLAEISAAHGVVLPAAFADAVASAVSADFEGYDQFIEDDAARTPVSRRPTLTVIAGGKA
jgi:hypothetical protein